MPPAKRKRHAGAGTRGASSAGARSAPSAAACTKLAKRLPMASAHAILATLMATSTEALDAVKAEVARRDAETVNLRYYANETYSIIYSLEGVENRREQYTRAGDLRDQLIRLVEECRQQLSVTQAFEAIAKIMECIEAGAEGEVRKRVLGCGGIDQDIAQELAELVEEMSEEQKASVGGAVDRLDAVVEGLSRWCSGSELSEVVKTIRGDEAQSSEDDEE